MGIEGTGISEAAGEGQWQIGQGGGVDASVDRWGDVGDGDQQAVKTDQTIGVGDGEGDGEEAVVAKGVGGDERAGDGGAIAEIPLEQLADLGAQQSGIVERAREGNRRAFIGGLVLPGVDGRGDRDALGERVAGSYIDIVTGEIRADGVCAGR